MSHQLILIVVLILLLGGGGWTYWRTPAPGPDVTPGPWYYGAPGILSLLLTLALVVLLLRALGV